MNTTEQALKASSGPVLPETLAGRTGRTPQQTIVDLSMLSVQGKAEEIQGRWRWKQQGEATAKPSRAKGAGPRKTARKSAGKPQVAPAGGTRSVMFCGCAQRTRDTRTGRFVKTRKERR